MKKKTYTKGYITLLSVVIVAALSVAVTIGMLSRGIVASKNVATVESAIRARLLADVCGELALEKIHITPTYTNPGTSETLDGTCSYTITNLGGNRRSIISTGVSGIGQKKIDIEIDGIFPYIIILSWNEI